MKVNKESVYVIVLNYNNAEDTIECLKSIELLTKKFDLHTILVDNGSNVDCVERIKGVVDERTVVLWNKENKGYAAGNNDGIRYAIENNAEYIVILNNDVIVNVNSFDSCIDLLKRDEKIAIVGPVILDYSHGTIQSTGASIDFGKVVTPLINYGKKYVASSETIECDYVGGACMLFRADLINEIGYIPEEYFLFWEETEWCNRAKSRGLKILCTMDAYVYHKGSATINKISGLSTYYMERNKVIFLKRNAPNRLIFARSMLYIFLKAIYKGIRVNIKYFKYLLYYFDGIIDKDRLKKGRKGL